MDSANVECGITWIVIPHSKSCFLLLAAAVSRAFYIETNLHWIDLIIGIIFVGSST